MEKALVKSESANVKMMNKIALNAFMRSAAGEKSPSVVSLVQAEQLIPHGKRREGDTRDSACAQIQAPLATWLSGDHHHKLANG